MSGYRLASGGRIDRTRTLGFRFNGRALTGHAGDTLASALIASGVSVVGRSFKYHRPRGIMTAGSEEPNALVQLGVGARTEPNIRATQIELFDGLEAASVNAWPSVDFDLGAINSVFSRLFVAGFYYKTFMRPKFLWDGLFEPVIRRMAGMGRAPTEADPDRYDKMHLHCDVLVVGAGPAGLAAALAAARTGARVVLADEQSEFGGALLGRHERIDGAPASLWVEAARAELAACPEVTLLPRTTVFGYYDHNYLMALERRGDHLGPALGVHLPRQRLWHLRAKRVVLATGAHERPLVFRGNDTPGVMMASAAQAYANRYGVAPGHRGVVFANNDDAYGAAADLAAAGIAISAIIDVRTAPGANAMAKARTAGIEVLGGYAITAVGGGSHVHDVTIGRLDAAGTAIAAPGRKFECDFLAMSGGWNPAVHLFSQSQGKLRFDPAIASFVPDRVVQAQRSVGACAGALDLAACLAQGLAAGAQEAQAAGFGSGAVPPAPLVETVETAPLRALWVVPSGAKLGRGGKHFVDFQNDVTAADIELAAREGFHSVEHVKRYTTTGMGTDQGKTSNVNALAILSATLGQDIAATGTTTFRAPYTPVAFGALAGRDLGQLSDPVRITAMHDAHVARGAVFEDVGQWKRPLYFTQTGEHLHAAVRRECYAVRNAVGVLDASTLGKIDIQGPDAATFLNRIYTNAWTKLAIGSARYGLMCREDGMVFDDGVTARLAEDRFLMTTTTGGAARVLDWLEEWLQTEWPELRVYCTSVTEQWATVSIAGPRARQLLRALAPEMALEGADFPFMTFREGRVAGLDARVFRISFTGELAFEVNVPTTQGAALWEAVMAAGTPFGVTPYGTEAMHVLRAEKGFIIVGQETDGTVTPQDLGMDWIVSASKDFIGRRSQARSDAKRADRKQLVGLLPLDPEKVLPEGAQLVDAMTAYTPVPMIGHVTSSYWSPTLGRSFALALVRGGRARLGQTVLAPIGSDTIAARITEPVFYDKEGARRDG